MESRGNLHLVQGGVNIGTEQVGSTLHFGPNPDFNGYEKAHFTRNSAPDNGFNKDFHLYGLEWTPDFLRFSVDGVEVGTVQGEGFWQLGNFNNRAPGLENPWRYGSKIAPFDQEVGTANELNAKC